MVSEPVASGATEVPVLVYVHVAPPDIASLPTSDPDVTVTEQDGVVPVPELLAWFDAVIVIGFPVTLAVTDGWVRL
jgi:hypothetical protein